MHNINHLLAISPVDGRYFKQTESLIKYFSEWALIKYRIHVEIEYFIYLCELGLKELPVLEEDQKLILKEISIKFDINEAKKIKEIENTTNHDVKAVEYYLKEKFNGLGLSQFKEFIHFGLTSQDINNTAVPLSFKNAIKETYTPLLEQIIEKLLLFSRQYKEVSMLAHTHGQPASPTQLGKEIFVFVQRLKEQKNTLEYLPFTAKFGGATGNLNAHLISYPSVDWNHFSKVFVEDKLGLTRSFPTTQIEHYDYLAAQMDSLRRINTILIDFSRDVWQYISMGYFKQKISKNEIGSSTMPHKVNPIDFENAEGNLGLANALLSHLSEKLPISRLQRDLTDSTVLRNIGVPLGYTLIAFQSLLKGIAKLEVNFEKIQSDLEDNWIVVSEAIQTILRREHFPNPYEALKELTRTNSKINQKDIHSFINQLSINEDIKRELKKITPHNYTGYFFE